LPKTVPLLMSPDPAMTAPIHGTRPRFTGGGLRATRFAPVQGKTPLAQCGCHSFTALAGFQAPDRTSRCRDPFVDDADVREADAEIEREFRLSRQLSWTKNSGWLNAGIERWLLLFSV
jgi:hypothetical protein